MAAIKEHERVILTTPMPEDRLEAGDVGTVLHGYRDGRACEVEFTTLERPSSDPQVWWKK